MLAAQVIVSLDLYHINYNGNSNHHMRIRTAGVQFMRDNQERFVESDTKNSWLRYLNMSIPGTWTDALINQAVADALKVTIQVAESNQGFAPLMYRSIPKMPIPPPGQTLGHLTFLKTLVKFPAMLPVLTVKCPTC